MQKGELWLERMKTQEKIIQQYYLNFVGSWFFFVFYFLYDAKLHDQICSWVN